MHYIDNRGLGAQQVGWGVLVASLLVLLAGCGAREAHAPAAGSSAPGEPPAGEVWLTPEQVREARIETAPVAIQDVDDTILTSGKVTFDDSRVQHVYSPISGRVKEIMAQLGEHVVQGTPLLTIESPDVGVATSDLGKAAADLIASEHDYKRQKELLAAHATSQRDFETAEDNYRKARAELERARQKTRLFHAGSPGVVDQVTGRYTVQSQIAGEVITRSVYPGLEIQGQYAGGTPFELFTIGDLQRVWVMADVFEQDFNRVHVGADVEVRVVSYPKRRFKGKVDWVSGALDPATRTAKVRCTLENPDRALRPEMYATVYLSVDQEKALAIPRSALLRLGDQTVVFIAKGQTDDRLVRFERIPVTVDEGEGSQWVPVKHGLSPGMQLVVSGAILLSSKT